MKKDHYSSLRKNIYTSMIFVPGIPFLLALATGYYYFTTSIETSSVSSLKRIVEDHRQMIENFLQERKADLEFTCNTHTYEDLEQPENIRKALTHLQEGSNAFVDLGVFDGKGIHIAYSGPYELKGKVYGETEWFKKVTKNGYYISDIFLGFRNVPHFIIAIARGKDGAQWVLRATIDTFMFNELVKKLRIGETGESYILNREGVFQTERRSGGNLMSTDPDNIAYPSYHTGIKTFIGKNAGGEKYLYATAWLKDGDWQLVVRQQKKDAFKALRSASYLILLISVIGGVIIAGLAFYMTDRIIRRLERLDAERESLSGQLIRATQLAELGEMAAGFAHEINNPLQIMNNEQALMLDILADLQEKGELSPSSSTEELKDSIEEIHRQIARCTKITQAILKFGRKSESKSIKTDLNEFVDDVISMIEQKASVHAISIVRDLPVIHAFIKADPTQLQQVFLNLCNNAIDAIIEKYGSTGGQINIHVHVGEKGETIISVTDNGIGISSDNLSKIFSPFFTTKPIGKGTGLGLSVCYGIINDMAGELRVESIDGEKTIFTIILPATS